MADGKSTADDGRLVTMALTDDDLEAIRQLNLRDDRVRIAAAGFITAHLQNVYHLAARDPQIREALDWFVNAVGEGGILEAARDLQQKIKKTH